MTPAVDLRPDHRKIVENILRDHLPDGVKVWVFGSRADWTTKESSDLDLALEGDVRLDSRTVVALELAFEESSLPFGVDVMDLHRADEGFREIVLRGGKVLVKGSRRSAKRPDWVCQRLGDISVKIGSGATPRGGNAVYLDDGPCALIRSQNVLNNRFSWDGLVFIDQERADALSNVEVFPEDVLLNITGDSVARACQVDPEALPARVNQHVAILRPDPEQLDPRFLRYFLVSPTMQRKLLSWAGSGGTRKALTKGMIESFEVPAPKDVREQRAIARLLGALDDRIELNRRMNQTLEAMARALFKSWFVDFDPVLAKMQGRDTGLPPDIADLFPSRLVDSELGQIPEGWRTFGMQDLAELHKNTMDPSILGDSDVEHFSIPAFDAGRAPTVQPGRSIRSNKTVVPTKAVLLSKLNPETSRVWVPHSPRALPQLCSTEFLAFTPKRHVSRSLLYGLFTSRGFRGLLMGMVTGTSKSHQRVQPRALAGTAVLAGTAALFDCYDRMISGLLESVPRHRLQMQRLGDVRDTLLPKLVAGEIRLPAALVSEAP